MFTYKQRIQPIRRLFWPMINSCRRHFVSWDLCDVTNIICKHMRLRETSQFCVPPNLYFPNCKVSDHIAENVKQLSREKAVKTENLKRNYFHFEDFISPFTIQLKVSREILFLRRRLNFDHCFAKNTHKLRTYAPV